MSLLYVHKRLVIMGKTNVYLIARIAEEYHRKNEELCTRLDSRFNVFLPHQHNPFNLLHTKLEGSVAQTDYDAINRSDLGLISEPFGNDCSCEIGYYFGRGKPTVLFVENVGDWQRTWMAKYAITAVAAGNREIEKIVRTDPILKNKPIQLVETPQELSDFLYDMANKGAGNAIPR